jgi:hypothetical protein
MPSRITPAKMHLSSPGKRRSPIVEVAYAGQFNQLMFVLDIHGLIEYNAGQNWGHRLIAS